jgi:hypothetical protein
MCWAARDRFERMVGVGFEGALTPSALSERPCAYQHIAPDQDRRVSLPKPTETAVFKSALTFFAIVAGAAKRLPLFRSASIERELEQTLCLVRCCREQREEAATRRQA